MPCLLALSATQAAQQLYSIYIGRNPAIEPATVPSPLKFTDLGVAITNTNDLSAFSNGLSIVSNQTLYLLEAFNQVTIPLTGLIPATSIFAPDIKYGISGINPSATTVTGQTSLDQASPSPSPSPGSPILFSDAAGNPVSTLTNKFTLTEITDPTTAQMPPITRLTLLLTVF